jgi:dipeptidyl aminopeptidase/acylaminoacyl peptidase
MDHRKVVTMRSLRGMVGLALALVAADRAVAQEPARPELTVSWIMRGPELVGREPSNVRWTPDGAWIHFTWLPPGSDWREPPRPYRVRARPGAEPEELSPAVADSLEPLVASGPVSPDGRRRAVSVRGDLWLVELPSGRLRRLTDTPTIVETPLRFDRSGTTLFFRRDHNVLAMDLTGGGIRQLTDIREGPAPPADSVRTGQRAFLAGEEERLIAAVRDRIVRDSLARAERERREALAPRPFYLRRGERVTLLDPSPDATHVVVAMAIAPTGTGTQVPNYVTTTGYTEQLGARPKVGDEPTRTRVGLLEVASGNITWLHPDPTDTAATVFGSMQSLGWNDAGGAALLWVVTEDYSRRYLHRLDAPGGALTTLDLLVDTAWVGGPCFGCAGWLPGDQGVYLVSEADGWAHLYTLRGDGTGRRKLTSGPWEVLGLELSPSRTEFRLHTSEPSVFERHFYTMPVTGGPRTRLTTPVGGHTAVPSPDGRQLAVVYSEANRPPELFLQPARPGGAMSRLTTSPAGEWLAFPWVKPEIVMIPASDGVPVPARIYRPADLGSRPNGAAVIFVHGAGYLQNVHHRWSSYFREYMFHHLLAQRGYVVLDLDYRASAGYGRDWRTAVYRHMGGRDLQDHVDGARWLQAEFGIPPERIGIYGGSYGGFITLMALFTEPDWFGAGAALRAVTDWAHYNHPYTSRILNLPQDDSVAFRQSSPIYFAEGLRAPLLIAHGMVDVNVQFQDVVRLAQRLIELGKENWELAVYPVEDHGFVRPDSWTDEYRRILELFERHLRP